MRRKKLSRLCYSRINLCDSFCVYVLSREVDMCVRSEVWSVVNHRLQELLHLLNSDSNEPEAPQTLSAIKGLAFILRLAALCSSPTK